MTPPDDAPDEPAGDSGSGGGIDHALDPDYAAILAAVTETARGRWFLDEYARRNRTADTRALLSALRRIEQSMNRPAVLAAADLRAPLSDLVETLRHARVEIAAVPRYEIDGAVRRNAEDVDFTAESEFGKVAAREIHEAAERIQEIAWGLRERNVSGDLCDALNRYAVDIQGACRSVSATLKGMDALSRAVRRVEVGLLALLDHISAPPAAAHTHIEPTADEAALGRFLEDIALVDIDDVGWHGPAAGEGPQDVTFAAPGEAEPDAAPEPEPADSAVDAGPAADDAVAPTEPLAAVAKEPVPMKPVAEPPTREEPPADLTGLTFDQKMILFS